MDNEPPAAKPKRRRRATRGRSGPGPRVGLFQDESKVELREIAEIIRTEHLLAEKVWYDRFQMTRNAVAKGTLKVVPDSEASRRDNKLAESVWSKGNAKARIVEDEHGLENVGPYSDFEWGMLNGKLSAIRWLLGEEWDILST